MNLADSAALMRDPPNPTEFEGIDKLKHFAAYAFMILWFAQISMKNRVRWAIALAFVMLGVTLEYLQRFSGYRTFECADTGANTQPGSCVLYS